jgi:hypothetical protein
MTGYLFTNLGPLSAYAKMRAQRGIFDGTKRTAWLVDYCRHRFKVYPDTHAVLVYTRDTGHHSSGWWKNPDYERCLHLSISFVGVPGDEPLPFDKKQAESIARFFFGDDVSKCWIEPPYSDIGKAQDVWHYRLFCDAGWQPIAPRKEVYSREFTEAGWKSFSDLHGDGAQRDALAARGAPDGQ